MVSRPVFYATCRLTQAATFTVDSTLDEVDANVGDCVCLTASLTCTLRAAIQEANACQGDDTINLSTGTYAFSRSGRNEDQCLTGDLDITGNLTINGVNPTDTIIDGSQLDRVFHIIGGATVVNITGVTIRNGALIGGWPDFDQGGGLKSDGIFTINNSIISNNKVTSSPATYGRGGGIFNSGTLSILKTVLSENGGKFESDFSGGGIFNNGGDILLENVTIGKNTSGGAQAPSLNRGGGLANFGGGQVIIRYSTIAENIDPWWGSNNVFNDSGGSIQIENSIIYNNATGASCNGTIASQGHNLDNQNSCQFTLLTDLINTDPKFGPFQDNGGNTLTHALLPGSPAINQGDSVDCPAMDQRGVSRPKGAGCDIGAFEADFFHLFLPLILRG